MKTRSITFFSIGFITLLLSCKPENKVEIKAKSSIKKVEVINDTLDNRKHLRGAVFNDTIFEYKSFFFSNLITPDRFELKVFPGLIVDSKTLLTISTFDNHIIYSDTFESYYWIKFIFDPETYPKESTQEEFNKYLEDYANSITKKQFEKYALDNIRQFFSDIFVNRTELKDMSDFGTIFHQDIYDQILSDSLRKVIYLPCFECDEGLNYLTYSSEENKAIIIMGAD